MVRNSNDGSTGGDRLRQRAEARRLAILRAAGRVFRRRGFAAAGMREIATEAGLSPGNLYHYFKGKQEILFFCQDRALDRLLAALDGARLGRQSAAAQLRAVLASHVSCLLDEVEGSAAHLEVEALPTELRRTVVNKRDRYERGLTRLVGRGVSAGELVECDPKLVTRAILGAINWTARWYRPDGPQPVRIVAGGLADYLVRGLERLDLPKAKARASGSGRRL